jgi:ATP-dependent Clp protease adaptor protein ClpS
MPDFPDVEDGGVDVLPDKKIKLEKPKLFKVLLHNDDFTTMDFVVFILEFVFNKNEAQSVQIMLSVHTTGVGVAGVYPYEIATTKCDKAMNLAKARQFPLLCTVEEE